MKLMKNFFGNYFVTVTFLSLIIFRLNALLSFNLSIYKLYALIILSTIIGSTFLKTFGHWIMNLYIFQWLLFHFLKLKDDLYFIIIYFLCVLDQFGRFGLLITVIGGAYFIGQILWVIFVQISYPFQLPLFIPMFFFSLFNIIERMLIFNLENIKELKQSSTTFTFEHALIFLGIHSATNDLKKKQTFPHIQQRYFSWHHHIQNSTKILIPLGTVIGFGTTFFLNYQDFMLKKDQFDLQQKQFEFQQKQALQEQEWKQKQFEFQQKQFDNSRRKGWW